MMPTAHRKGITSFTRYVDDIAMCEVDSTDKL